MPAPVVDLGVTPATAEQHAKITAACGRLPISESLALYQRATGRTIEDKWEVRPLTHAEATVWLAALAARLGP
jgi:hypothetical protein